jgi:hypothetical protein
MKRLIVLSLLMAAMLFAGGPAAPAHGQSPPNDLKPTFISPTPGLYVNGWPAFTVSYPKEWVELPLPPLAVFVAAGTRPNLPPLPVLSITVSAGPLPLEDWAKMAMPIYTIIATDIKILSDRPARLKDGAPAREVELEFFPKQQPLGNVAGVPKLNNFILLTKSGGGAWVWITLTDDKRIVEDLKKIASSLAFQPAREEPVKVPPDVRAFLDMYCSDVVGHGVKAMMAHFSDRFHHSGMNKPVWEQMWQNSPDSPVQRRTISSEATVTVFEPRGEKAYIDGFVLETDMVNVNALKFPMFFQQIIREHGQWKWFGNQK